MLHVNILTLYEYMLICKCMINLTCMGGRNIRKDVYAKRITIFLKHTKLRNKPA